jgi:hypothetical protein
MSAELARSGEISPQPAPDAVYLFPVFSELRQDLEAALMPYPSSVERADGALRFARERRKEYETQEWQSYDGGDVENALNSRVIFLNAITIAACQKLNHFFKREVNEWEIAHHYLIELVNEKKEFLEVMDRRVKATPSESRRELYKDLADYMTISRNTVKYGFEEEPSSVAMTGPKELEGLVGEYKVMHGLKNNGFPGTRYATVEEDIYLDNEKLDVVVPTYSNGQIVKVGIQVKTKKWGSVVKKIFVRPDLTPAHVWVPVLHEDPFTIPDVELQPLIMMVDNLAERSAIELAA